MRESIKRWKVSLMFRILGVNESGYYRFIKRPKKTDRFLLTEIKAVIAEHPYNHNYGYKRVDERLRQKGTDVGWHIVRQEMKAAGLVQKKTVRPVSITKRNPDDKASRDIVKRNFYSQRINELCVMDITQIVLIDMTKLYLAILKDCCDGRIVYAIGDRMDVSLCLEVIKKAFDGVDVRGMILHTDRGGQFTSKDFQGELERRGIISSMGERGNCFDNARMESFIGIFKKEFLYQLGRQELTRDNVISGVFRYMNYYNCHRVNSFNEGGWPPEIFRQMLTSKLCR
jgi:transposase InsO family protein